MKKLTIIAVFVFSMSSLILANTLSDITVYKAGVYPRGIAIADMNSDAVNDVIVANFGEDTLIGQENDVAPTSSVSIFNGPAMTEVQLSAGVSLLMAGRRDWAKGDQSEF